MRSKIVLGLIALVVSLLWVRFSMNELLVSAQEPTEQWAPQQRIPDYDDESYTPCLVADQDRTIHVFNYQPVDSSDTTQAIMYRSWSLENGWSSPIDILLSPRGGEPKLQDVFLDHEGTIHLIFFGGNESDGGIYYSSAPAAIADRAPAWSTPREVGINAGPLASAALAADDRGNLVVVYTGKDDGNGLYEVHSMDDGETWSTPGLIMRTFDELLATGTRVTVDDKGYVHAVWSLVDSTGTDQEIYYARSSVDFQEWTEPYLLAQRAENDYKAAWPAIISHNDELIVVYMQGNPATRWMRRSRDDGNSWSEPVRPFPHVGEYDHVVLLEDSSNTLHILLGNRLNDQAHGMWHGVWLGNQWGPLEPVVTGPKTPEFDPSAPRAVVSQGNLLFVAWWTDTGGAPRNGAWYSYKIIDAPELPVVPLPTPAILSAPVPVPSEEADVVESEQEADPAKTIQFDDASTPTQSASPAFPVMIGVVSSVLLAAFVIIFQRFHLNHR